MSSPMDTWPSSRGAYELGVNISDVRSIVWSDAASCRGRFRHARLAVMVVLVFGGE
jgi:hypothetical protein